MKEVAKMLKSLGPNYTLKWEWSFFQHVPMIRMTLAYLNPMTQMIFQYEHEFPEDYLNDTDGRFGSQALEDMHRRITEKVKEYWAEK